MKHHGNTGKVVNATLFTEVGSHGGRCGVVAREDCAEKHAQ